MFTNSSDRRSFLARLAASYGLVGAAVATAAPPLVAKGSSDRFQPARHPQDDWMDKLPGKHRIVFDSTTPAGFGAALAYAFNLLEASKDYGLKDPDTAIIIVARHFSTPYAYNDAVWTKYSKAMPPMIALDDPRTKQRATVNLYNVAAYSDGSNMGTTIDDVLKKGVHFAVCQLATKYFAGLLAKENGGSAEAAYSELTSNLVGNSHMVAAGIVAVNRAQEHGFTLTTAV